MADKPTTLREFGEGLSDLKESVAANNKKGLYDSFVRTQNNL